jgi:TldD protein
MAALLEGMLGGDAGTLGQRVAAPVVSVRGDRSQPAGAATVGWDDEGVAAETFALVEGGVLIDRATTRSGAADLASWYGARGRPVRSHGCTVGGGMATPRAALPNLTLAPASSAIGVRDLVAGVRRGIYFSGDATGSGDAMLGTAQWWATSAQEIRNGRLVGYVRDAAMQFPTTDFWQSLDGIGGRGSVEAVPIGNGTVRAVPGRFRRVNIVSTAALV